ncbi:hypothetical protein CTA1_10018 [Colletotrichum tanaceti]|uniref:Uncharacterized protein n=1 Tax=Colletotrichum tanaceti TaxID=1306861 RepID=A0A4V6DKZ1_9PEZI|nr:hypothetical protein CTA1_10018 [Colletotrichum tanaceti]
MSSEERLTGQAALPASAGTGFSITNGIPPYIRDFPYSILALSLTRAPSYDYLRCTWGGRWWRLWVGRSARSIWTQQGTIPSSVGIVLWERLTWVSTNATKPPSLFGLVYHVLSLSARAVKVIRAPAGRLRSSLCMIQRIFAGAKWLQYPYFGSV